MSELKSSIMGGYSKKSVDTYIVELQNENEILKKQLEVAEQGSMKAEKYLNENNQLRNEISDLKETISDLEARLTESEKSNSDYISNIGNIFYSAYESGAKITEDAKIGSQEFLRKISSDTSIAKSEIKRAIESYTCINNEIKSLLSNLTAKVNEVSQSSDDLIKRATIIAQEMDGIEAIQIANENKAKQAQEEYKEFFNSFNTQNQEAVIISKPAYPVINTQPVERKSNIDEAQSIIDSMIASNDKQNEHDETLRIRQRLEQIKNTDVISAKEVDQDNDSDNTNSRTNEMRDALKKIANNISEE